MDRLTYDDNFQFSAGFTEYQFLLGEHICSFYEEDKERFNVIVPFIKSGLLSNHKCIGIFSKEDAELIEMKLQEDGFEVKDYLISNQLLFLTSEDFFVSENAFDAEKTLDVFKKSVMQMQKENWQALRIIGEWAFILKFKKDQEKWIEYEARVSYDFANLPAIILCLYNQKKFDGDFLINLIKTHPFITMGKEIYVNPFFKEPKNFIDDWNRKYNA